MSEDQKTERQKRLALFRELFTLGLSVREITSLLGWSYATGAKDLRDMGGERSFESRPPQREVFASVLRHYAQLMSVGKQSQITDALADWLNEPEILGVINGVETTMTLLSIPEAVPAWRRYVELLEAVFEVPTMSRSDRVLAFAGELDAQALWYRVLNRFSSEKTEIPGSREALFVFIARDVLRERRQAIMPQWIPSVIATIETVVKTLPPNEQTVLRRRFGLGNDSPQTCMMIAEELKRTRSRIGQLESAALEKLRKPKRFKQLRPLFTPLHELFERALRDNAHEHDEAERSRAVLLESIQTLDVSPRAMNALTLNNVTTIGEIVRMSYGNLLALHGMGVKSAAEVVTELHRRNLWLGVKPIP